MSKRWVERVARVSALLRATQQDDGSVVALRTVAAELADQSHQALHIAIVVADELLQARASELLLFAVQRFRDAVGVEEQAEIAAQLDRVLGEVAGQQAELTMTIGGRRGPGSGERVPGVLAQLTGRELDVLRLIARADRAAKPRG